MSITAEQLIEELAKIDDRPIDWFQERMDQIEEDFDSVNEVFWYGKAGQWTKCPIFNVIDVVCTLLNAVDGCDDMRIGENGEWELEWERKTVNALKRFCRKYAKKVEAFSNAELSIIAEVGRL